MNKIQKIHAVLCILLGLAGFIVGAVAGGVKAGFFLLALSALWWAAVSVVIRLLTPPDM